MGIWDYLKEKALAPIRWPSTGATPVPPVSPSVGPVGPSALLLKQNWPLQRDCTAFYGDPYKPGWYTENTVLVPCPWKLVYENTPVAGIRIHKKCAASLTRVLNYVWAKSGKSQKVIEENRYHLFSGSYNLRPMRGASQISMHGYACAIDWDDADNQFHNTRHLFTDNSLLVQAFKAEGWEWGGDWSPASVDAMHVQAARTR
jgi:hypothetical protein